MAINDVTYLLDESLQLLKKIHDIETDIDNKEEWDATPMVEIIIKNIGPIDFIFL